MSGWLEGLPTLLFELVIGFPCISNLLVDSYPKVIAMSADVWRMNSENSERRKLSVLVVPRLFPRTYRIGIQ